MDETVRLFHPGRQVNQLRVPNRGLPAALARVPPAESGRHEPGAAAVARVGRRRLQRDLLLSQRATGLPGAAGGLRFHLRAFLGAAMAAQPGLFPFGPAVALGGAAIAAVAGRRRNIAVVLSGLEFPPATG